MKKLNYILLTLSFCLLSATGALGQPPEGPESSSGPVRDWINTKRIGYFTDKLDLTSAEAEKFWPVYNAYIKEMDELRDARKKNRAATLLNLETMTDKQVADNIDEEVNNRQKEVDLLKKYVPQYKTVLPIKKVAILMKAEEEFKVWILKEWKNNGLGSGGGGKTPR